ncbi:MAG TPA: hypothetical protein VIN40_06935 [Candidatus Tyrphobacter sp.]
MLRRVRLLDGALGTTPLCHLIVLSALVPAAASLRERAERLFVRIPLVIAAGDMETMPERERLIDAARMTLGNGEPETALPTDGVRIAGLIDSDRVEALIAEVHSSPLGSVNPWILCAELLGTSIEYHGARCEVLEPYRRRLLDRLAAFADQSPQIFVRWLVNGEERELDERLAAVLDALRGAAALASRAP